VAAGPTMPTTTLQIVDPCPGATNSIQCRFVVGADNRAFIYENAPTGYAHPPTIDSGWLAAGTLKWDIDWGNSVYGGHIVQITVYLQVNKKALCSLPIKRDIWILGNSLPLALFSGYLATLGLSPQQTAMLTAIAKVEGFGSPTQFEPKRGDKKLSNAFHYRCSLYEVAHGGYGLLQLTNPVPSRDQIWNWKSNISGGLAHLNSAITAATNYLNTHPNPPITPLQIRLETYAKYNGGNGAFFHVWQNNAWIEDPRFKCNCNGVLRKGIEVHIPPHPAPPVGTCRPIAQCYAEYAHSLD